MNSLICIALFSAVLLSTCAERSFQYVRDTEIDSLGHVYYGHSYFESIQELHDFQNYRMYLGIVRRDTFLGGELTFTLASDYNHERPCVQYSYLLFDDQHNVYYNTVASDSVSHDTLPEIPYTVGLDTLTIDDEADALQGKYFINNDTITLFMESKEQDEPIEIIAILTKDVTYSLRFLTATRKRLTYSPLHDYDRKKDKQKKFSMNNLFSIDMVFHEIPSDHKIIIRREDVGRPGKGK